MEQNRTEQILRSSAVKCPLVYPTQPASDEHLAYLSTLCGSSRTCLFVEGALTDPGLNPGFQVQRDVVQCSVVPILHIQHGDICILHFSNAHPRP